MKLWWVTPEFKDQTQLLPPRDRIWSGQMDPTLTVHSRHACESCVYCHQFTATESQETAQTVYHLSKHIHTTTPEHVTSGHESLDSDTFSLSKHKNEPQEHFSLLRYSEYSELLAQVKRTHSQVTIIFQSLDTPIYGIFFFFFSRGCLDQHRQKNC